MNIIAAADKNWGIGKDGKLLVHIKEDMKFFKEKTTGKAVIMGRETFLSLPGQQPLKERKNFILTTNKEFKADGAEICHSFEEAVEKARKEYEDNDIFLIGGEKVYSYGEKYCRYAYITKIDEEYPADRYITNFDLSDDWKILNEEMVKTEKGIYITFAKYENVKIKGC